MDDLIITIDRILHVKRGGQKGWVCIEIYANYARVAAFLPGNYAHFGDMRLLQPTYYRLCKTSFGADDLFDMFVGQAYDDFWENDNEATTIYEACLKQTQVSSHGQRYACAVGYAG